MKIVSAILFLALSQAASADIHDRINACEQSGGGACVFNLLRELAQGGENEAGPGLEVGVYKLASGRCIATSTVTQVRRSSVTISYNGSEYRYECTGKICVVNNEELKVTSSRSFSLKSASVDCSYRK